MTDTEKQFIAQAKAFEAAKEAMNKLRDQMLTTAVILGVGHYLQDPETGAVYKIARPTGTYVEFREIGYERTALPGETRGSLSKKEASEMGFVVPDKKQAA